MSVPTENQDLPDALVEILNDLDAVTLRTVHTYVVQQLNDLRPPLQEQIRSEANGEIVDIQDCEAYMLVRQRPPSEGNSEEASQPLSLYRVKQETQLNGEESLHWSYLGDVIERSGIECENCSTLSNTLGTTHPHRDEETDRDDEGL